MGLYGLIQYTLILFSGVCKTAWALWFTLNVHHKPENANK